MGVVPALLRMELQVEQQELGNAEVAGVTGESVQHARHQEGVVGDLMPYGNLLARLDYPQQGALSRFAAVAQRATLWESVLWPLLLAIQALHHASRPSPHG
jgi:hypothetical protein